MSKISDVLKALDRDGFRPALRALKWIEGLDRETRLLAVTYARRVQHLMITQKRITALDVSERYANNEATEDELEKAMCAAWAVKAAVAYIVDVPEAAASAAEMLTADSGEPNDAFRAELEWQEAELRRVCECIEAGTDPYPRGES